MKQRIGTPLKCPQLHLQPETAQGLELSETMQQALALLTAFWQNQRVLLQGTPSGALFTCSSRYKDGFHVTASGDNDDYQGNDVKCSEVVVMGHPSNTGNVWCHGHSAATTAKSWPLAAGEVWKVTLTNLKQLHLLIETDTEKAIVMYSD